MQPQEEHPPNAEKASLSPTSIIPESSHLTFEQILVGQTDDLGALLHYEGNGNQIGGSTQ